MSSSPPHPPKKLKMSSTTTSDADDTPSSAAGEPPRRRYKRRKVAIFLGYCGAGYQGMQKNPGARTIEGDLEEALFLADAVPAADRGLSRRYEWARSARTDKGVSAAAQVVSGRFYVDPPGFVARLNAHLPDQITVFGFTRVTNSFSAKKFCDRRRYVYLLPVFSLDPSAHPDRESVTASIGSDNELTRCLECSERGRKIPTSIDRFSQGSKQEGRPDSEQVEDGKFELTELEKPDLARVGAGGDLLGASDMISTKNQPESANSISIEGAIDPETITELRASNVDGCGNPSNRDTVIHDESNEQLSAKTKFYYDDEQKGRPDSELVEDGKFESTELEKPDLARVGAGDDLLGASDMISTKNQPESANSISIEGAIDPETITELRASSNVDGCGTPSNRETVIHDESNEQLSAKTKFYYDDEQKARFNRILQHYVGTHNFHNFTTRIKPEDPSARRYIISFLANSVVCIDGIEFVKCEVIGQSFMLHQIRKMIGLAVAVMRNCAPESLMDTALRKDVRINVPTAPEVGLYLDECQFTSYNKQWKDSHEPVTMDAYAEEAEDFKMKYIYPHIASMEHKEGAVALWLHSLNHRNYPDLCFMETRSACAGDHEEQHVDALRTVSTSQGN